MKKLFILSVPIVLVGYLFFFKNQQTYQTQTVNENLPASSTILPFHEYAFADTTVAMQSVTPVSMSFTAFSDYTNGRWPTIISDKKIFNVKAIRECIEITQSTIPCFVSRQWGQSEMVELITTDSGMNGMSFYVFEPVSNAVLHGIILSTNPEIQILAPVDGVGLDESFKRSIATIQLR